MAEVKFTIDIEDIATKLDKTREVIEEKVVPALERLSISTHAFIVNKANQELDGFKRDFFLGNGKHGDKTTERSSNHAGVDQSAKHVRWTQVTKGIWVVEIDEKAAWIEEGRPPTSMATEDWLLKPGKAKRAKDGSLYRSIPFKQLEGGKPAPNTKPAYQSLVKAAMRQQNIHQTRIEKNQDGSPKLGIIHRLNVTGPEGGWQKHPGVFSKPRTDQEAAMTGFKPHEGIFHLKGAVVTQRMKPGKKGGAGKVVKETVVFRTVSSKHQMEGRWMAPEVKPFGAIPAAHKYAQEQWETMMKALQEELNRAAGGA